MVCFTMKNTYAPEPLLTCSQASRCYKRNEFFWLQTQKFKSCLLWKHHLTEFDQGFKVNKNKALREATVPSHLTEYYKEKSLDVIGEIAANALGKRLQDRVGYVQLCCNSRKPESLRCSVQPKVMHCSQCSSDLVCEGSAPCAHSKTPDDRCARTIL